jgi:hypothetical protein
MIMTTEQKREALQGIFLDFMNNYITAERYAEDMGLHINECLNLIAVGRKVHEQIVKDHTPN